MNAWTRALAAAAATTTTRENIARRGRARDAPSTNAGGVSRLRTRRRLELAPRGRRPWRGGGDQARARASRAAEDREETAREDRGERMWRVRGRAAHGVRVGGEPPRVGEPFRLGAPTQSETVSTLARVSVRQCTCMNTSTRKKKSQKIETTQPLGKGIWRMRSTQLFFIRGEQTCSISSVKNCRASLRQSRGRSVSPMSKDDSEEEDDPPSTSLAPLLHHLAATVVYLVVGYTLWVANQDAPTPAVALSDREKRVLHYSSLPEGWVETRLPTTAKGWASLAIVSWMTWNWIRRLIRAKAIVDARARARAALNRLVLAAGAGGDDVVNPCSDPKCLRCVPSAHDAAIARNGERLRALMRDDQTFAAAVSPAVVTLARQTGAETRARLHAAAS